MKLVEDDAGKVREQWILLQPRRQDPFGGDQEPCLGGKATLQAHLPADLAHLQLQRHLGLHPRQRGAASSLQAFTSLVSNAVVAGVLSPWLSRVPLHLALGTAVFAFLGWAFWRWEIHVGHRIPDAPMSTLARRWTPPMPRLAIDSYWRAHPLRADQQVLARPLADALTMRMATSHGIDYGRVRLWGSLAFILAGLLVVYGTIDVLLLHAFTGNEEVGWYSLAYRQTWCI